MFFYLTVLSFIPNIFATATCYTPNGTDRNTIAGRLAYVPCDNTAEVSMCCQLVSGAPDVCQPGGFCFNPFTNVWWRESCTDKTWQSPACLKLFLNGTGLNGTGPVVKDQGIPIHDVALTLCENGSWCSGERNRLCCQQGKGVFYGNVTQTNQTSLLSAASPTPQSTTSLAPSSSSSAAASSTGKPKQDDDGLSTGVKAGIGVGSAVGGVLIIALVALFFIRRRSRSSPPPAPPTYSLPKERAYWLDSTAKPLEMDAERARSELQGNSISHAKAVNSTQPTELVEAPGSIPPDKYA